MNRSLLSALWLWASFIALGPVPARGEFWDQLSKIDLGKAAASLRKASPDSVVKTLQSSKAQDILREVTKGTPKVAQSLVANQDVQKVTMAIEKARPAVERVLEKTDPEMLREALEPEKLEQLGKAIRTVDSVMFWTDHWLPLALIALAFLLALICGCQIMNKIRHRPKCSASLLVNTDVEMWLHSDGFSKNTVAAPEESPELCFEQL